MAETADRKREADLMPVARDRDLMFVATNFVCAEKEGTAQRMGRCAPLRREQVVEAFQQAEMVLDVYDEMFPREIVSRGKSSAA
jgi:hypothetical protein